MHVTCAHVCVFMDTKVHQALYSLLSVGIVVVGVWTAKDDTSEGSYLCGANMEDKRHARQPTPTRNHTRCSTEMMVSQSKDIFSVAVELSNYFLNCPILSLY